MTKQEALLRGKVVLVSGAGGSIGSELCRQIAKGNPRTIILLDICENGIYELQQELRCRDRSTLSLSLEIASVQDEGRIHAIFSHYRPQLVFHAAAHKHVPLMEDCPGEAIKNNVLGTYHMARCADRFGAQRFVLISSDKAVHPQSVMGATKRFGEMLLQALGPVSKTAFSAVRFGNVLGSAGSVVPLFLRQIEQGGPVTITDRRMIRYFMTIPEAVQLVLRAAAMEGGPGVYLLDMGHPVRIIELAERIITLSGRIPYQEIAIVETGLRPGEKLYEELLLYGGKAIRKTAEPRIFVEGQPPLSLLQIERSIALLHAAAQNGSAMQAKQALLQAVPEYRASRAKKSIPTGECLALGAKPGLRRN